MDEYTAIARLQDYFKIQDDSMPTPLLDEAVVMAYQALANQRWLRDTLVEYMVNPTAVGQGLINDLYKVYVFERKDGNYE